MYVHGKGQALPSLTYYFQCLLFAVPIFFLCVLVCIVKQAEICLYLKCCGFSSATNSFERCEIDRALV